MKSAILRSKNWGRVLGVGFILLTAPACMVVSNTDVPEESGVSTSSGPKPIGDGLAPVVPAGLTHSTSVVAFDNILRNMSQVTGTTPSATTLANYNQNRTTYAQKGNAEEINAAMWLAVATLASNVCLDLFNKEKALPAASRVFFKEIPLTGGANFNAMVGADTAEVVIIKRMHLTFTGKVVATTDPEVTLVDSAMDLIESNRIAANMNENKTRMALIMACGGILASLRSIEN